MRHDLVPGVAGCHLYRTGGWMAGAISFPWPASASSIAPDRDTQCLAMIVQAQPGAQTRSEGCL